MTSSIRKFIFHDLQAIEDTLIRLTRWYFSPFCGPSRRNLCKAA